MMRILAVDDEPLMLERLCRYIREAKPDAEIISFHSALEAMAYVEKERVDVAFLDIQMRGLNGIDLGKKIKILYPKANVIFCTGYGDYIYEAVSKVRCNGYLTKPFTAEDIIEELENLRVPADYSGDKRVYIRCFGNFDIFVDHKPLEFEVSKTKEILAYLVDRCGSMCKNREIVAALWEDEYNHDSYLKKCRSDLLNTLKNAGCEDIIIRQWGSMGIDCRKVNCDYYAWRENRAEGINAYRGEYMEQYSFGEYTKACLENR